MGYSPQPTAAVAVPRPDVAAAMPLLDIDMEEAGFIALRVLPPADVGNISGTLTTIAIEEILRDRALQRAEGSAYARDTFRFATIEYATKEYGLEYPVDQHAAANYRDFIADPVVEAARISRFAALSELEQRAADAVFNTTTWTGASLTTTLPGGSEWNVLATANPIKDVIAAKRKMRKLGFRPNALILSRDVFEFLKLNAAIQTAIASTGAGASFEVSKINEAVLAQVFDIEQVIVAGALRNTANQGLAAVITDRWSVEYAMLAKIASPGAPKQFPCLGRTMNWTGDGSDLSVGGIAETYFENQVRGDVVRFRHDTGVKIYTPNAAHLIQNVSDQGIWPFV